MSSCNHAVVSGAFDDLKSPDIRFLQEAGKLGGLTVLVAPDVSIQRTTGKPPKFPLAERLYFLNALRYVGRAIPMDAHAAPDDLPAMPGPRPDIWADVDATANAAREKLARENGIA